MSEGPVENMSLYSSLRFSNSFCRSGGNLTSLRATLGLVYVLCLPMNAVFSRVSLTETPFASLSG